MKAFARPLSILTAAAVAACSGAQPQALLRRVPGQNVLLITIDTLRADALSAYGGPASTPALDRLAAEGVRFDFAHAHAVVTLPSHASILTGTYPFQHGLRDNSGYRLVSGTRTAATMLKQAGYATAAFIAAFPLHSRFGLNVGFDVYDERFGETRAPAEFVMPERPATDVVPLARAWISRQAGRWFCWVHLYDPHAPYRPPTQFNERYASRPYYGEVAAADAALAPLFEEVRASGRPTLVIVTADHGESLGEHGEESHGLFAYESTLRVPLIITDLPATASQSGKRPESATPGERSPVAARHIDILPTILEAVGQTIPADLPGRALLAATERLGQSAERVSYFEAMGGALNRGWAPLAGVVVGREKFIDLPIAERYDLATDPMEQSNLAGRSPNRDRTMAARLRAFHAAAPGARMVENTDAVARLRALGYASGRVARKEAYDESDDPKRLVELDRMVHRAVDAFTAGRFDESVRLYRAVIDRRPDMGVAYRHLAFVESERGNVSGAIDLLQRAIRSGVTDVRVVTQLAGYVLDSGRADVTIRMLEPFVGDPRADADMLNTLGIAYAQAHRADASRRMFEHVAAINPTSSIPVENLGMLALDSGDFGEARRQFERAVGLDPRSSRAHSGLGATAMRRGDRVQAMEEWTRAVQLDPANVDALYNLGITLARAGRKDEARPYLERFLRTATGAAFEADRREVARLLAR